MRATFGAIHGVDWSNTQSRTQKKKKRYICGALFWARLRFFCDFPELYTYCSDAFFFNDSCKSRNEISGLPSSYLLSRTAARRKGGGGACAPACAATVPCGAVPGGVCAALMPEQQRWLLLFRCSALAVATLRPLL